jgi:hypothetical protein
MIAPKNIVRVTNDADRRTVITAGSRRYPRASGRHQGTSGAVTPLDAAFVLQIHDENLLEEPELAGFAGLALRAFKAPQPLIHFSIFSGDIPAG